MPSACATSHLPREHAARADAHELREAGRHKRGRHERRRDGQRLGVVGHKLAQLLAQAGQQEFELRRRVDELESERRWLLYRVASAEDNALRTCEALAEVRASAADLTQRLALMEAVAAIQAEPGGCDELRQADRTEDPSAASGLPLTGASTPGPVEWGVQQLSNMDGAGQSVPPPEVVERLPLHRLVRGENALQLRVHQPEVDRAAHARRDGRGGRLDRALPRRLLPLLLFGINESRAVGHGRARSGRHDEEAADHPARTHTPIHTGPRRCQTHCRGGNTFHGLGG